MALTMGCLGEGIKAQSFTFIAQVTSLTRILEFNLRPSLIMRFSIASLVVMSTYLLTARAGEFAMSTEATQFGSGVQSGPTIRELLVGRQSCQQGFGFCSNTGVCCPTNGDCCPKGKSHGLLFRSW